MSVVNVLTLFCVFSMISQIRFINSEEEKLGWERGQGGYLGDVIDSLVVFMTEMMMLMIMMTVMYF